jgi:hypothetical protein
MMRLEICFAIETTLGLAWQLLYTEAGRTNDKNRRETIMAIQKKSLIGNLTAAKKAVLAKSAVGPNLGTTKSGLGAQKKSGLGAQNKSGLGAQNKSGLGAQNKSGLGAQNKSGLGAQNKSAIR